MVICFEVVWGGYGESVSVAIGLKGRVSQFFVLFRF